MAAAVKLFELGKLSSGRAAQLAGMTRVEFLLALRRINWQGPILLDQFPFREDPVQAARSSIRTIRQLDRALDRIDLAALAAAQDRHDALAAQGIVMDLLLGAPDTEASR